MIHRYAILSESASVDAESGIASLFNLVDQINITVPPGSTGPDNQVVLPIRGVLAILTARSNDDVPETGNGRAMIVAPNGRELGHTSFVADMTVHKQCRTLVKFGTFPIVGEGRYQFRIDHAMDDGTWSQVDVVPLWVLISESNGADTPNGST